MTNITNDNNDDDDDDDDDDKWTPKKGQVEGLPVPGRFTTYIFPGVGRAKTTAKNRGKLKDHIII